MNQGLTGRMIVASAALAVIVGAAFGALLFAITSLRDSTDLGHQTQEELAATDALEQLVIDLETGLRGFVITREGRFLEPWNAARANLPGMAARLERLAADEPVDRAAIQRIVQAARSYIVDYGVGLVAAVRRGGPSVHTVRSTDEGKQRIDALRASVSGLKQIVRERLSAREAEAERDARRATIAAAIGLAGSMLLILIFTGYLSRVIVAPIRRVARVAGRLAAGELTVRLPDEGVGEIGELERAFNRMGSSLEAGRDELRHLAAEQAALRRVATLVAQAGAPTEIFSAVAAEVRTLFAADTAAIARVEPDGTALLVAVDPRSDDVPTGTPVALGGGTSIAEVLRTARPVRIDDYSGASGPLAEASRQLRLRSAVGCPIVVEDRLWGALVAGTSGDPLAADTEARLDSFTELVATAIANTESRSELVASRARIVAAADETRHRIQRDLHDAAQQRLVHTIVTLKIALQGLESGDAEARQLVREALEHAEQTNVELRELAHGILPSALRLSGLHAGVESILSRTTLPVTADVTRQRFPPAVEATAYFVISEALTNVVKHSGADRAEVRVAAEDGTLRVEVRDSGSGGVKLGEGTGLIGLHDRVAALDGRLQVASPPGGGTCIVALLPVAAP